MTNRPTWRRVAPAARSRPSSRTRSVTVIDSVLKMRNAPTNRATAAISAVVERKSAVETRSDAARSPGDERTYGSVVRATSRASDDLAGCRALADDDVDPADALLAEQPLRRPKRDDDRPAARTDERPVALDDPDDLERDRAAGAGLEREVGAHAEGVLGGEPLGDEDGERLRSGERRARDERQRPDLLLERSDRRRGS